MPSLSYREKTLYASLMAELVVYGPYFFLHQQNSLNKVAGMIVAIIVLQVVLQLIIAAFTRNRTTDERDRLIELRGYRAGYLVEASLMVVGLAMLWFHSTMGQMHLDNPKMGLHFLSVFFGITRDRGYHQDRHADCGLQESALMPAIRNQIRELRGQREITQQELADRVGVTRQTVIAMEQDKYSPSLETAFKVAIELGVPLDQCFQYDPKGKR